MRIPEPADEDLHAVWSQHLQDLVRPAVVRPAEELEPGDYVEGAVRTVTVNRYERNPTARQAAIEHHGAMCAVCGFNFGDVYGQTGEGFIHVHHRVELSALDGEYVVDPQQDLVPVCPNCHAMIHRRSPAFSVDELRSLLRP